MRRANSCARGQLVVVALVAAVVHGAPATALASVGAVATPVSLPVGFQVAGVAAGTSGVWVANGRAAGVARIDPRNNQVVAFIPVAEPSLSCDRCWGAVATRGNVVWAAMNAAGRVVIRIDPSLNEIAETVEVGVLPSALAVDEDGVLWLTATLENTVVRLDPRVAGAVARTAVHMPSGIVAGREAVWVTAGKPGANGQLIRIDPRTGVVVATIPVGRDPNALAVGDRDVWVANEADHTISRIDPHINTVVATIPVAHFPVGVVIGEGAIWIASRGSALLSVPAVSRIDPGSSTVVETTPVEGTTPIAMAAGAGSLWVASHNPDGLVRVGPVQLPASHLAVGGPPLLPVGLGAGTILLLVAAGGKLHRPAHRGDRRVRDGRLFGALLLHRQLSGLQSGPCEWRSKAR
jgi:YVTN family beta-propeller protein